jgi:hypothetical protein
VPAGKINEQGQLENLLEHLSSTTFLLVKTGTSSKLEHNRSPSQSILNFFLERSTFGYTYGGTMSKN